LYSLLALRSYWRLGRFQGEEHSINPGLHLKPPNREVFYLEHDRKERTMTDFIRFVPEDHRSPIVRRDQLEVVSQALRRHFPHEVSWGPSPEDASLRVTLPKGVSAKELSDWARQEKVIFSFDPDAKGQARERGVEGARDAMHLHWAHLEQAEVEEGIKRLGKLIVRYMDLADGFGRSPQHFIGS
jgi:hypothetical protein